jgi:hypothetical protein
VKKNEVYLEDGADHEAFGQTGGQVLQRVDSNVDVPVEHAQLQLLREQALVACTPSEEQKNEGMK